MHQVPVVLLGANYHTGLSSIRTLGRRGIPVIALDYNFSLAYGLASRYVSRRVLCPNAGSHEKEFVKFLVALASEFDTKPVLIFSHDVYALVASRHSDLLSEHYLFHRMPRGLLEQIVNKKGLYLLACRHNMKMPLTFFPGSEKEDEEVASRVAFPCLVKPSVSYLFTKKFRKKLFVAHDEKELYEELRLAREAGIEIMVQELVPGFDDKMYVLDVFIDREGRATHTMTAQKIRQFPANFGSSTLTHQLPVPELYDQGVSFLQRIGYRGYGEIEFKRHAETGEFYMIEVNARMSSLNPLFDACGLEYPYIIYRDLIGDPLPPLHLDRHLNYAFYHFYEDYFAVRQYRRAQQLSWKEIIKPFLAHKKKYAVWALDDPLPTLYFWKVVFARLWGKFVSKWRKKAFSL